MKILRFRGWAILLGAILLSGCTATVPREAASSASGSAAMTVCDRLYCGRNIPKGGEVSEEAWVQFLAEIVTPRFSEGLTMLRGEGQWRDSSQAIVRERILVLELKHNNAPAAEHKVLEI